MSVAEYVAPETLEGILAAMHEYQGSYVFMAGGTVVLPLLSSGRWLPHCVIGLWRAPLGDIERGSDEIVLGANVRLRDLALQEWSGGLSKAARQIGGPAVRNRATIGGNIASGQGGLIVALLALGARVTTVSPEGTSVRPIDELVGETAHRLSDDSASDGAPVPSAGGLVIRIAFTLPTGRSSYVNIGRKAYNTPTVAAVALTAHFDPGNPEVILDSRIAVHGLQRWPVRAKPVEQVIAGRVLRGQVLDEAEEALGELGSGFTDSVASSWYRSRMGRVALRRALEIVAGGGQQ